MRKRKLLFIGLPVVVVLVIIVSLAMKGNGDDGVHVQTEKVTKDRIVQTVTATGRIQPKTQVKISADVAAKIIGLHVKEGEWVEKGKLLVELDRERFEASVESAEANMRAVEANANLVRENMVKVEKDHARTNELFNKNLESQASLDQAYAAFMVEKARYQSTLEQVDQAKASLKQAMDDLSKTTIYAPMEGTISKLNKEVGEIALGSQFQEDVIMIVSNLAGMEALVDVDENDIVTVQMMDKAKIEVDALPDLVFDGSVSEMANSAKITASGTADQKTEFEVKISINMPGTQLRPGMTASADVVTEVHEDVLVVPIQSVSVRTPEQLGDNGEADSTKAKTYEPDKDGYVQVVFVIEDDKTTAKQVQTGIQSETHIEILDGISEDELIVTGNYRAISQILQNDSKVIVDDPQTATIAAQ